jgi:hypothetical protein
MQPCVHCNAVSTCCKLHRRLQALTCQPYPCCPACPQVAWDNVEELSAAAAHKKVAYASDPVNSDPLEAFCEDNPDADECR